MCAIIITRSPGQGLQTSRQIAHLSQQMTDIDAIRATGYCVSFRANGRHSERGTRRPGGTFPSACLRRVQELERKGVIAGYRAVIDRGRLGTGFTAYLAVGLSVHTKASQEAFERACGRRRKCWSATT